MTPFQKHIQALKEAITVAAWPAQSDDLYALEHLTAIQRIHEQALGALRDFLPTEEMYKAMEEFWELNKDQCREGILDPIRRARTLLSQQEGSDAT